MVFVAILLSKRFVIVNDNWIENPTIGGETRIFFSPDEAAVPDFGLAEKFLLNKNVPNVYRGYVCKHFVSNQEASDYIERKRPVFPVKYNKRNYNNERVQHGDIPLEHIDLCSSSSDDEQSDLEDSQQETANEESNQEDAYDGEEPNSNSDDTNDLNVEHVDGDRDTSHNQSLEGMQGMETNDESSVHDANDFVISQLFDEPSSNSDVNSDSDDPNDSDAIDPTEETNLNSDERDSNNGYAGDDDDDGNNDNDDDFNVSLVPRNETEVTGESVEHANDSRNVDQNFEERNSNSDGNNSNVEQHVDVDRDTSQNRALEEIHGTEATGELSANSASDPDNVGPRSDELISNSNANLNNNDLYVSNADQHMEGDRDTSRNSALEETQEMEANDELSVNGASDSHNVVHRFDGASLNADVNSDNDDLNDSNAEQRMDGGRFLITIGSVVTNENSTHQNAIDPAEESNLNSDVIDSSEGVDDYDTNHNQASEETQEEIQTTLEEKLIKKEKENDMLVDALKKANRRLGVEIISDTESSDTASDSDLNTDENVNTRHYQLDAEFAKKYYFITNSKGVRYYLGGEVKLKPNIVDTLKRSNTQYPLSSQDFDGKFVRQLLKAIFIASELKKCSSESSLRALNPAKLKFAKAIFAERTSDDSKRMATFRNFAIQIYKN